MDDNEKMTMLTSLTDEDDESILVSALDNAKLIILNKVYPFIEWELDEQGVPIEVTHAMPSRYDGVQVRIASYFLNKRGADGETQHNENNVYRYYGSSDVPKDMLNEIVPYGSAIK